MLGSFVHLLVENHVSCIIPIYEEASRSCYYGHSDRQATDRGIADKCRHICAILEVKREEEGKITVRDIYWYKCQNRLVIQY